MLFNEKEPRNRSAGTFFKPLLLNSTVTSSFKFANNLFGNVVMFLLLAYKFTSLNLTLYSSRPSGNDEKLLENKFNASRFFNFAKISFGRVVNSFPFRSKEFRVSSLSNVPGLISVNLFCHKFKNRSFPNGFNILGSMLPIIFIPNSSTSKFGVYLKIPGDKCTRFSRKSSQTSWGISAKRSLLRLVKPLLDKVKCCRSGNSCRCVLLIAGPSCSNDSNTRVFTLRTPNLLAISPRLRFVGNVHILKYIDSMSSVDVKPFTWKSVHCGELRHWVWKSKKCF